jgi:hypothetical protein
LCNTRRRLISLDESAALNATIAGDAAAVEDLRHAFCFFDADGNGTKFTTKLAIHGGAGVDPNLPEHRQAEAKRVLAAWRAVPRGQLCVRARPERGAAWRAAGRHGHRARRAREDVAEGCTASRPPRTWDAASARGAANVRGRRG